MKRVILVHGIREFGEWFTPVGNALAAKGLIVDRVGFKRLDALQFLMHGAARSRAEQSVRADIRGVFDAYPQDEISIIAFSFGTHAALKALAAEPNIKPELIIFSGAVASVENNDWTAIARRTKRCLLLNEVGTSDPWPVFAEAFGVGYGYAGTHAANRPDVTDRFHAVGHSTTYRDEPNGEPIYEEWARIISDEVAPAPSRAQARSPFWFAAISPGIRIVAPLLAAAAFALIFFHQSLENAVKSPIPPWSEVAIHSARLTDTFTQARCDDGIASFVLVRDADLTFNHYVVSTSIVVRTPDGVRQPTASVNGDRIVGTGVSCTPFEDEGPTCNAWEYQIPIHGRHVRVQWTIPERGDAAARRPGGFAYSSTRMPIREVSFSTDDRNLPDGVEFIRKDDHARLSNGQRLVCQLDHNWTTCNFSSLPGGAMQPHQRMYIETDVSPWLCQDS